MGTTELRTLARTGLLVLLGSACKATLDARVIEGADIGENQDFFVVKRMSDARGIDMIVREKLREFGRSAESGDSSAIDSEVDIAVLYEDQWEWDMSDFLLSLKITFRDIKTDETLAEGRSVRYSLARKPATEMTHEVIAAIFAKAAEQQP